MSDAPLELVATPVEPVVTPNQERFDGMIANALTGAGDPKYDKSMSVGVIKRRKLRKQQVEDLYGGDWLCANCIDLYPQEATRKWLKMKVQAGEPELSEKLTRDFERYHNRLGVREAVQEAMTWANLYGGAAILKIFEDGLPPEEPVNTQQIRSIRRLMVLDRYKIRPVIANDDPSNPTHYELILPPRLAKRLAEEQGRQVYTLAGTRIHQSRVIRFDGIKLPPDMLEQNEGWGIGILDRIFEAFNRYDSIGTSIGNLVEEASIFTYGIKGLKTLLSATDSRSLAILKTRLEAIRMAKSNLKALVYDADGEQAAFLSRSFAGLPEVMDRYVDQIIGASNIPASILFGRGPKGLAAGGTGEVEEAIWFRLVSQFQESRIAPILQASSPDNTEILDEIWLAKDGPSGGRTPEDWGFEFLPLGEPTQMQQLELREKQGNIDKLYKDLGTLDGEEIRTSRFRGTEFGFDTKIDDEAWEQKKQQESAFDDFGYGEESADPAAAEAPPEGEPPPEEGGDRQDSNEPTKYVMNWNGLNLGITHEPRKDIRHGRVMQAYYGHIRGSYGKAKRDRMIGGEDGMAIDCYLGPNPDSKLAYKVRQRRNSGEFDETKWIFGCDSMEQAKRLYLAHMPLELFGMIEPGNLSELQEFMGDRMDSNCGCSACQAGQGKGSDSITDDLGDRRPRRRIRKKKGLPVLTAG